MKKILIFLFVLVGILLISIYTFIPSKIFFREIVVIKANPNTAKRFLNDESQWNNWWSKENKKDEQPLNHVYKNYQYIFNWKMIQGSSITIKNNSILINSILNVIPINRDSVAIEWKGESTTPFNPISRIEKYIEVKKLQKNLKSLLQNIKAFLENKENFYPIRISQMQVKDTLLVATRYSFKSYPTPDEIYHLIESVQQYISKEGAIETNYPMLHITSDSGYFETMVAIPVNKVVPPKDNFLFKRMVPGKILVTEVKGGRYTTAHALKQLENYLEDNELQSPAIPFESLVTDRSRQPDTSKWVTKIYYPVY
jgi:hypothetical protein